MTEQKGVRRKTIGDLFFLTFLWLSMIFPAFGMMGDIFQEEVKKKE
jgi:hypothetical protein